MGVVIPPGCRPATLCALQVSCAQYVSKWRQSPGRRLYQVVFNGCLSMEVQEETSNHGLCPELKLEHCKPWLYSSQCTARDFQQFNNFNNGSNFCLRVKVDTQH